MPKSTTDRNLLFGILALQMDFISRDALIVAMNAWVLEKSKPLGRFQGCNGWRPIIDPARYAGLSMPDRQHVRSTRGVRPALCGVPGALHGRQYGHAVVGPPFS